MPLHSNTILHRHPATTRPTNVNNNNHNPSPRRHTTVSQSILQESNTKHPMRISNRRPQLLSSQHVLREPLKRDNYPHSLNPRHYTKTNNDRQQRHLTRRPIRSQPSLPMRRPRLNNVQCRPNNTSRPRQHANLNKLHQYPSPTSLHITITHTIHNQQIPPNLYNIRPQYPAPIPLTIRH